MTRSVRTRSHRLLVIIAVLAMAGAWFAYARSSEGAAKPSDDEVAQLSQIVTDFSKQNGDPANPSATAVETNRNAALGVLAGGDTVAENTDDVYAIQITKGPFNGYMASIPPGAEAPSGAALYIVVDAATNDVLDWGIDTQPHDLTSLGPTFDIPTNSGADARSDS